MSTARAWPHREQLRYGVIGLLMGLALGAVGAGALWMDGRQSYAALQQTFADHEVEEARVATELNEVRQRARSVEALLRARIAASRALDELDRANFGLARESLRGVGAALAEVDPALANVDPSALEEARRLATEATSQVAPDAATLRGRLVDIERAVDLLVPAPKTG